MGIEVIAYEGGKSMPLPATTSQKPYFAAMKLKVGGKDERAWAQADDLYEAIRTALNQKVGIKSEDLKIREIEARMNGSAPHWAVKVPVEYQGHNVIGEAVAVEPIKGYAIAYADALNQIIEATTSPVAQP